MVLYHANAMVNVFRQCGFPLSEGDLQKGEFDVCFALSYALRPRSLLELGVFKGFSAIAWMCGAQGSLRRYIGVDAEKYFAGSNTVARGNIGQFVERAITLWPHLQVDKMEWTVLTADTQTGDLAPKLKGPFDVVVIDAGHEFAEALNDLCNFSDLAARAVVVHDVVSHQSVAEAVQEFLKRRGDIWRFQARSGGADYLVLLR